MSIITFAVISLLCLMYDPTRIYGVIGLTLVFVAYPLASTVIFLVAGAVYHFIQENT